MFNLNNFAAGDWVRTTRVTKVTLTDQITTTGLPPGTPGVITARNGSRVTVDLATGYGTITTIIPVRDLRTTRAGGGITSFHHRIGITTVVRLALAGFLLWPFAQYSIDYVAAYGSFDGFIESLPLAALDSLGASIIAAANDPLAALVYAAFLTVVTWIAFPHRPKRGGKWFNKFRS